MFDEEILEQDIFDLELQAYSLIAAFKYRVSVKILEPISNSSNTDWVRINPSSSTAILLVDFAKDFSRLQSQQKQLKAQR